MSALQVTVGHWTKGVFMLEMLKSSSSINVVKRQMHLMSDDINIFIIQMARKTLTGMHLCPICPETTGRVRVVYYLQKPLFSTMLSSTFICPIHTLNTSKYLNDFNVSRIKMANVQLEFTHV